MRKRIGKIKETNVSLRHHNLSVRSLDTLCGQEWAWFFTGDHGHYVAVLDEGHSNVICVFFLPTIDYLHFVRGMEN